MGQDDLESLNLNDLDIEQLEHRIELGHLMPAAMPVNCAGNSCVNNHAGSCTNNGCHDYGS